RGCNRAAVAQTAGIEMGDAQVAVLERGTMTGLGMAVTLGRMDIESVQRRKFRQRVRQRRRRLAPQAPGHILDHGQAPLAFEWFKKFDVPGTEGRRSAIRWSKSHRSAGGARCQRRCDRQAFPPPENPLQKEA